MSNHVWSGKIMSKNIILPLFFFLNTNIYLLEAGASDDILRRSFIVKTPMKSLDKRRTPNPLYVKGLRETFENLKDDPDRVRDLAIEIQNNGLSMHILESISDTFLSFLSDPEGAIILAKKIKEDDGINIKMLKDLGHNFRRPWRDPSKIIMWAKKMKEGLLFLEIETMNALSLFVHVFKNLLNNPDKAIILAKKFEDEITSLHINELKQLVKTFKVLENNPGKAVGLAKIMKDNNLRVYRLKYLLEIFNGLDLNDTDPDKTINLAIKVNDAGVEISSLNDLVKAFNGLGLHNDPDRAIDLAIKTKVKEVEKINFHDLVTTFNGLGLHNDPDRAIGLAIKTKAKDVRIRKLKDLVTTFNGLGLDSDPDKAIKLVKEIDNDNLSLFYSPALKDLLQNFKELKTDPVRALNLVKKIHDLPLYDSYFDTSYRDHEIVTLLKEFKDSDNRPEEIIIWANKMTDVNLRASFLKDLYLKGLNYEEIKMLVNNRNGDFFKELYYLLETFPHEKIKNLLKFYEYVKEKNSSWNFGVGNVKGITKEKYLQLVEKDQNATKDMIDIFLNNSNNSGLQSYIAHHFKSKDREIQNYLDKILNSSDAKKSLEAAKLLSVWKTVEEFTDKEIKRIFNMLKENKYIQNVDAKILLKNWNKYISIIKKSHLKEFPLTNLFSFFVSFLRSREFPFNKTLCKKFPETLKDMMKIEELHHFKTLLMEQSKRLSLDVIPVKGAVFIFTEELMHRRTTLEGPINDSFDPRDFVDMAEKSESLIVLDRALSPGPKKDINAEKIKSLFKKLESESRPISLVLSGHGCPNAIVSSKLISVHQVFESFKLWSLNNPDKDKSLILSSCRSYDFAQNLLELWTKDEKLLQEKIPPPLIITTSNKMGNSHNSTRYSLHILAQMKAPFTVESFIKNVDAYNFILEPSLNSCNDMGLFHYRAISCWPDSAKEADDKEINLDCLCLPQEFSLLREQKTIRGPLFKNGLYS